MLARCTSAQEVQRMVPPLDVAFAWLVHRLNPVAYQHDLAKLHGSTFASTRCSVAKLPTHHIARTTSIAPYLCSAACRKGISR